MTIIKKIRKYFIERKIKKMTKYIVSQMNKRMSTHHIGQVDTINAIRASLNACEKNGDIPILIISNKEEGYLELLIERKLLGEDKCI